MRFALFLALFLSTNSFAYTQPVFTGNAGMVLLRNPPPGEGSDDDAIRLFNLMNVPPQDTVLGPGKNINTPDQIFNLVCGNRGAQGFLCNIIVRPSSRSKVSMSQRYISFTATGEEAKWLHSLFYIDENGNVEFVSQDAKVSIHSRNNIFQMEFR